MQSWATAPQQVYLAMRLYPRMLSSNSRNHDIATKLVLLRDELTHQRYRNLHRPTRHCRTIGERSNSHTALPSEQRRREHRLMSKYSRLPGPLVIPQRWEVARNSAHSGRTFISMTSAIVVPTCDIIAAMYRTPVEPYHLFSAGSHGRC